MGSNQDGNIFRGEGIDVRPELSPGNGIDPGRWFVEKQDFRLMQERGSERKALLEAKRQLPGSRASISRQIKGFEHGVDSLFRAAVTKTIHACKEGKILCNRNVPIQGKFLRHIAESPARIGCCGPQIIPGNPSFAFAWRSQTTKHFERRRFARAIGTKQPKDFPALLAEGDVRGCSKAAVAFCETARFDDGLTCIGMGLHRINQGRTPVGSAA